MTWFTPRRPSAAMIVSIIALVVALGGTGYAAVALPRNSVGTKQLKKRAVTSAKLKAGAVNGSKVSDDSLAGTDILESSLAKVPSATSADSASHAADSGKLGGVAASRYVRPGSTLASGDTEVGAFGASAPNGSSGTSAITFVPKLPGQVPFANVHDLAVGATSAECPGPRQAAAGHLCFYTGLNFSMTLSCHASPFGNSCNGFPIEPEGVVLHFSSTNALGTVRGNWAYTAP
jgi:hypothetical protein